MHVALAGARFACPLVTPAFGRMTGHRAMYPVCMGEGDLGTSSWSVDDDQIAEAAPRVRALQIQRYEHMWTTVHSTVQAHLAEGRPLDPRYLEIGIRILKEEAALYRLHKVTPPVEEEQDQFAVDMNRMDTALAQLAEIEERMHKPTAPETPEP